jgi:hypothetical protein
MYGPFGREWSQRLALLWVVWLLSPLGGSWLWGGQFGVSGELLVGHYELWLCHLITESYAKGGKAMGDDG